MRHSCLVYNCQNHTPTEKAQHGVASVPQGSGKGPS